MDANRRPKFRNYLLLATSAFVALAAAPQEPAPATNPTPEVRVPDDRLGSRVAPILLLTRDDVRAELQLSPEQSASAKTAVANLRARAAALRGKRGPEVLAERQAIDQAQEQWLVEALSPEQRARLSQLDLQWEGPSALITRPTVADSLRLTPEQRATIAESLARFRTQLSEGQEPNGARRQMSESILATLQPPQREQWKAMLGAPLAVRAPADSAVKPASATEPKK